MGFRGIYLKIGKSFIILNMNGSKEFHINEYLSLKLEEGKTNIYVNGNFFRSCGSLILNIPTDELEYFDEVKSIDEIAEIIGWPEDNPVVIDNEPGNVISHKKNF